jgi:hypothetical protein
LIYVAAVSAAYKVGFMKKFFALVPVFFLAIVTAFSQNTESPVPQMDEAVRTLARDIHAKLVEKRAGKITVGQFTYLDGIPPFSSYWVNQLIGELTNTRGRNYSILSSGASDAEWTLVGEIVQVADIIRVYSRLIHISDRSIEASFYSSFQRNEHINDMISVSSSSSGGSSAAGGRDSREPDSWENPVTYTIGSNSSTPVMNRTITEGDEDFFLLVPDRDGRLTAETTGSIDTYMYLYNYENDDELASNDDGGQSNNARIVFSVSAGTRYLAVVRGYSSSTTGAYGFRAYITVREGASSWNNPSSYEIGIGEDNVATVNRSLQEGDEEYFLLLPGRDGRLVIETTGRTDTYLELFNAENRELLEENDDGGQNYNARIRYNVQAGSRYIAKVSGYGSSSGSFGFRAFFPGQGTPSPDEYEPDDEPSQAKPIEAGTPQQRTFHSGNDVDWVSFNVTRAGRYTINAAGVNSNRLDTYIELYDSNMNSIAQDDDGGDSLSSRLSVNLQSGTYYLKVWCLDDEPDQGYTLSVSAQ